jgi:hypothetical protein
LGAPSAHPDRIVVDKLLCVLVFGGGEVAGRSPVDRGKHGLKRSIITDATGIPPWRAASSGQPQ